MIEKKSNVLEKLPDLCLFFQRLIDQEAIKRHIKTLYPVSFQVKAHRTSLLTSIWVPTQPLVYSSPWQVESVFLVAVHYPETE